MVGGMVGARMVIISVVLSRSFGSTHYSFPFIIIHDS